MTEGDCMSEACELLRIEIVERARRSSSYEPYMVDDARMRTRGALLKRLKAQKGPSETAPGWKHTKLPYMASNTPAGRSEVK